MSQPTTQPGAMTQNAVRPQFRGWTPLSSRFNPFLPPIFITLILLIGNLSFGILESYSKTLLAIATAITVEMALGRIFLRKWPHPASAYISGISVGILLRSPAFWPYALCSALSITSKYALRVRGRHIWNPSNFGSCAMLILASQSVASLSIQWGNNFASLIVIWVLGSVIVWRAKRFHITLTYVVCFIALSFLRAHITGDPWQSEIAPITGPMYQLFIFFMITDPKTTVRSRLAQCAVAAAIAVLEFFFRLNSSIYAPLYALFWIGPVALLIEMAIDSRRARAGAVAAIPAQKAARALHLHLPASMFFRLQAICESECLAPRSVHGVCRGNPLRLQVQAVDAARTNHDCAACARAIRAGQHCAANRCTAIRSYNLHRCDRTGRDPF